MSHSFADLIGSGGQSRVYSARMPRSREAAAAVAARGGCKTQRLPSEEQVAVKVSKQGKRAGVEHEVAVLAATQRASPDGNLPDTIVHYKFSGDTPEGDFVLGMEMADIGDGFTVLDMTKKRGLGDCEALRQICRDTASALEFCHTAGTAHRDVKPENFLFFSSGLGPCGYSAEAVPSAELLGGFVNQPLFTTKLADFGCAVHGDVDCSTCRPRLMCTDTPGSVSYRPPEMHVVASMLGRRAPLHEAAKDKPALAQYSSYDAFGGDVWSWAIAIYVMASAKIPFEEAHIRDPTFVAFLHTTQPWAVAAHPVWSTLSSMGHAAVRTVRWRWPKNFPPSLIELLSSCLRVDPAQRPTITQVLQHPWMQAGKIHTATAKVCLPLLPLASEPISMAGSSTINSNAPHSGHSTPGGCPLAAGANGRSTVSLPYAQRSVRSTARSERTLTVAADEGSAAVDEASKPQPFSLALVSGRGNDSSSSLSGQRCEAPRRSPKASSAAAASGGLTARGEGAPEDVASPEAGAVRFFAASPTQPSVQLPSTSLNSTNTSFAPHTSLDSAASALSPQPDLVDMTPPPEELDRAAAAIAQEPSPTAVHNANKKKARRWNPSRKSKLAAAAAGNVGRASATGGGVTL